MSVRIMSMVWDRFPLGSGHRLIMLALADCANDQGGSIYPSVATLANKTQLSDRRVRQILADLEANGWIISDERSKGGTPRSTTNWTIVVERLQTAEPLKPTSPLPLKPTSEPLKPISGVPLKSTSETPEAHFTRPVMNRQREPSENHKKYTDAFVRFWEVFPSGRKTKKRKAFEAWKRAVKREEPEVIISAAAEYADSPRGQGPYVLGPEPWLNGDCWDDDRDSWAKSGDEVPRGTSTNEQSPAMKRWLESA